MDYVSTQNTLKLSFLVQVPNFRKTKLDTYNHRILCYTSLRGCRKKFRNFHHVDCKILAFEVTKILILAL